MIDIYQIFSFRNVMDVPGLKIEISSVLTLVVARTYKFLFATRF